MMKALAFRRSQILALTLLIGAVALTAMIIDASVVAPLAEKQKRIDELQTRIATLENASARLGDAERWTAAAAAASDLRELFVDAPTAATGVAALQAVLRTSAQGVGVELRGAQPFEESEGALDFVGVRVGFTGRLDQVAAFLSVLEAEQPVIFVRAIDMRRGREAADGARVEATASIAAPLWPAGAPS